MNDGLLYRHVHSHYSLFEVSPEGIRLVVLNFAMLDRSGPQKFIHLYGINSCCTLFILRGLWANPVVEIIRKRAAHLLCLEGTRVDKQWVLGWCRWGCYLIYDTRAFCHFFLIQNIPYTQSAKSTSTSVGFTGQISSPGTQNQSTSQTYRQKYVTVPIIKASKRFLRDLYQLQFLLHTEGEK